MRRSDRFKTIADAIAYLKEAEICKTSEEAREYITKNIPKEKEYQRKIIECLKANHPGSFIWKAAAGVYSRGGVPDICAIINGRFYGFEVKRPYLGKLSGLQKVTLKKINQAGGITGVVTFPEDAEAIISREESRR